MKSQGNASFLFYFFLSPILLSALSATALGQTADLSGAITDSSRAAVPGASVTITKDDTGVKRTASSNEEGFYRSPFLLPGSYTVAVEAAGFRVVTNSSVKLDPGQQARLDFTLLPAGLTQSITVRDAPFSVQTESPALGTEINPPLVKDLPLNGRTLQSLIALAPGVVMFEGIVVNGQRTTANYFTVDGVSADLNMQCPSLQCNPRMLGADPGGTAPVYTLLGTTQNLVSFDGLQEFKLQTSTTPAEFGRAVGGQVQIVTRSGSNDFHGSLYDYFRNEALNANDWFANSAGLPRAPDRQNNFGGTFGGPILKNRTFFFFSYEGLRLLVPGVGPIQVPSMSARQAATGDIQQLFDAFPLPNGPEDPATMVAQFTANNFSRLTSSDNTSIRIDHKVSQKLTLFGRYSEASSNGKQGGYDVTLSRDGFRAVTFGATLAPSPKTTSDLRLNYSRTDADRSFRLVPFGGSVPPPDSLLFPAPFASPDSTLTVMSLPMTYWVGRGGENLQRQGNLVSNTSIVEGRHDVKFGVDYRYLAPHIGPFPYRLHPSFASLQSALSGITRETTIQSFDSTTMQYQDLSLYGQDNWMVTPRFTLIYGLRWELNPAPFAKGHQQLVTLTGFPDLANIQLAPLGTPIHQTTYDNFAPRFGAAYQLFHHPGRETVIRGGFGIFYDLGIGDSGNAVAAFPHLREKDLFGVSFPLSPQNALPPPPVSLDPPYGDVFNVFAPNYELPRSYQWNLTVDQSLGSKQVLSASYVGEAGRRLLRRTILFDPNPRFSQSTIFVTTNGSSSDYHALQVQFQRSMSRGLAALLSYTWSHSVDDTSNDVGFDNFTNPRLDRGPSDFDVRHIFSAAVAYDFPRPGESSALRRVLSDWSIDTIFTGRTALPVYVYAVREDVGLDTSFFNARPDLVPGAPLYIYDPTLPGGRRINPAAFTVPVEVRQGNLGRNALRGFPLSQLDFAVTRQFSVTEKVKLLGRVDFFNLFNHPNFGAVDGQLGFFPPSQPNPDFGMATGMLNGTTDDPLFSTGGPRSIQLSLRLNF